MAADAELALLRVRNMPLPRLLSAPLLLGTCPWPWSLEGLELRPRRL